MCLNCVTVEFSFFLSNEPFRPGGPVWQAPSQVNSCKTPCRYIFYEQLRCGPVTLVKSYATTCMKHIGVLCFYIHMNSHILITWVGMTMKQPVRSPEK